MFSGISRRHFLSLTAALGAGAVAWTSFPLFRKSFDSKGLLLSGGRIQASGSMYNYLTLIDLNSPKDQPKLVQLPFFPHGISFHPLNPNFIALFEKKGPGACLLDLRDVENPLIISPSEGRYFYGHGAFSEHGQRLFAVETSLDTSHGHIVIRDAFTLEIEGEFPTYGSNPHDCQLIQNGRVLAITNGGGTQESGDKASITYVDIETQKLLNKFEIQDNRFNAGHLDVSSLGDLVVVSAPRLGLPETSEGAISLLDQNGEIRTLQLPKETGLELKSETLSVCIDEDQRRFAATSPAGNNVSFWDLDTGSYLKSIILENPRGVILTLDNSSYIISYGHTPKLIMVNAKTLEPQPHLSIEKTGASGSHLYLKS